VSRFLNIKTPYKDEKHSWCTSEEEECFLNDNIFKQYQKQLMTKRIVYKRTCILKYFKKAENNEKHHINIECYHLEYIDGIYQNFLYIPKKDIDNFIRKQKLKNII
jgi:hypothetical protein